MHTGPPLPDPLPAPDPAATLAQPMATPPFPPGPAQGQGPPLSRQLPDAGEILGLTDRFLTGPMAQALRAVEHPMPPYVPVGSSAEGPAIDALAAAQVEIRHVPGTADALYRIAAFGDVLTLRLQLNVWRFVLVYTVPARDLVDVTGIAPRFARWQTGAGHAGWTVGWRDAVDPWAHDLRRVETYCYAMLPQDFLLNEAAQLYWRTDIMQMTRGFMLEARRGGVPLAAPDPGADPKNKVNP